MDLQAQLSALGIKLLDNGLIEVKGQKLPLDNFLALGLAKVKSKEELIERLASQLYSNAKTKHLRDECVRIVKADNALSGLISPFVADKEDYFKLAEQKVAKRFKRESEQALED